jgi:hypothetical protein
MTSHRKVTFLKLSVNFCCINKNLIIGTLADNALQVRKAIGVVGLTKKNPKSTEKYLGGKSCQAR